MPSINLVKEVEMMDSIIVVWPDYDWCWVSELHEYTWKSDDYTKVEWQSEEEPTESELKLIVDNGYLRTDE